MLPSGDGEGDETFGCAGGDGDGLAVYGGDPAGEGEAEEASGERFGVAEAGLAAAGLVALAVDGDAGGQVKPLRWLSGLVVGFEGGG